MDDWRWMTAQALGAGIADGAIDPVALCETYLEAIAAHPSRDRIYARVTPELARAQAQEARARARSGTRRGPLDGVPVSWKDLFDTKGIGTEAGTALMKGRVPKEDAEAVRAGHAAGLVCLGKTHMSEIAFSGLGVNPVTATPPNVNDADAAPGGSSSGAAASVAFGLAAAAVGSDTGGSVRVPSAWNDLVGYRPSFDRISTVGAVPLCRTLDGVGPLCRTLADARLMVAALSGTADALDARAPRRLGILETIGMEDLEEAPHAAFTAATAELEAAGITIERVRFDALKEVFAFSGGLYTADAWSFWGPRITANPGVMFEQIETRVTPGREVLAADYLAHWARLREVRNAWRAQVQHLDAVILPSVPILPPPVARLLEDGAYYKDRNLMSLRNTRIANLLDLPSVTLPGDRPSCGVMLFGQTGADADLLAVSQGVAELLSQKTQLPRKA
ncbi:amidase [Salipiger sp. IMCC34102]|uniref:amidase n=1 Tax=Salipiger sp. IMCC34102 TaxID=2510647 RepID=UPI00101BB7BE|nr:amidase family protein [Salipiger sp. IMCC34102]RYH04300.1 amidase [Salipiger sp. IMCC34102]